LSDGLPDLIAHCLMFDPKKRPTASDVRQRLGAMPTSDMFSWSNDRVEEKPDAAAYRDYVTRMDDAFPK